MKNIVVCLDGTGNRIRVRTSTNVVKLFDLLDKRQRDAQVAFYEPGVGTFSSARAWTPLGRAISRGLGLAFGVGMLADIEEVYRYLMNTYEPGDRIFLFGFSRGAYCACAVVGLLHYVGLLRQKSDNLVRYAVSQYTGGGRFDPDRVAEARMFADIMTYGHGESGSVPVTFLGLWDTVHAPGAFRRRRTSWPYTRGLPNVLDGRHALSIDETRRPYRAHPISSTKISQVWFAGVHSDIGGGYADEPALSDITLKWMVDAAMKRGCWSPQGNIIVFGFRSTTRTQRDTVLIGFGPRRDTEDASYREVLSFTRAFVPARRKNLDIIIYFLRAQCLSTNIGPITATSGRAEARRPHLPGSPTALH